MYGIGIVIGIGFHHILEGRACPCWDVCMSVSIYEIYVTSSLLTHLQYMKIKSKLSAQIPYPLDISGLTIYQTGER